MSDLLHRTATRLWHDPVISKVIGTLIGAAILWVIANHFDWGWAVVISALAFALLLGLVIGFLFSPRNTSQIAPNIATVSARIETPDPNSEPLTFPLKCRVTLRNDSTECADVRFSDYARSNTIRSKKDLPFAVLQLRFQERWWPIRDGVDRIAVLPHQLFRAWVGLDETMLSGEYANQLLLRGELGALVLSVNGTPVSIELKP